MNLFKFMKKNNYAPDSMEIVKIDKEIQQKAHVNPYTEKTNDEMMAEVVSDFNKCSAMFEKVMQQFIEKELESNISETGAEILKNLEESNESQQSISS